MTGVRPDLPSGTVTFLFTDVEGSTRLLYELGPDRYAQALAEHRRALREAFARYGGVEVDTQGDAFFVAFPTAEGALGAAADATEALAAGPIHVRVGIHTGTPHLSGEGYAGEDVHLGARIAAAGHGGQVLVSRPTADRVEAELTELGEHRLKDFDGAIAIFQLGSKRFPPLRTISNTNLPRPASSFVGRERELAEVTALLRDGARLVTLSGPGGSGKTRLALEAASELVPEFKAGVFWVGLAPLSDPALVPEAIAQTLGVKDGLAEHVGERELLLLLDNLEQVVEAAPELGQLLETCPKVKLLVTSRELLRIRGEVEYAVPPLTEPEAVSLFCARAQTEPDETIAELCRRLDNLPLALELAAARTSVLSPQQILERLAKRLDLLKGGRDAEARQQTLRAAIAWSHDLLDAEEQRLFARLATFVGGCTLEAVEGVCEADLDVLHSLVDKSLVRHTQERFWMLETIREFARERLEASGEAEALRGRHAEYCVALAEEAEPHLQREAAEWHDRLENELDNFRAALEELPPSDHARLIGAAWPVWSARGSLREAEEQLERAVRAVDVPGEVRAKVLTGACDIVCDRGAHARSAAYGEQALALHRTLGNRWGEAYTLLGLGLVKAFEGSWPEALDRFERSSEIFSELGDEYWALRVDRRRAWAYEELGDIEKCLAVHEDNLRRARAIGDEHMEAQSLARIGSQAIFQGRIGDAVTLLAAAHQIHRRRRDIVDRYWDGVLLCRFARALAQEGHPERAAELIGSFEALLEELEMGYEGWVEELNEETVRLARSATDDATLERAREQGRRLTVDEAVEVALASVS